MNVYESIEERGPDGKWKKERRIGGIAIWGMVALAAIITGYTLPAAFWSSLFSIK